VLGTALEQRAGALLGFALCFVSSYAPGGLDIKLPESATWTGVTPIKPTSPTQSLNVSPSLRVRVPVGDDRCSNQPLPCTPYPEGQRLRRQHELRSGFLSADALRELAP
jgi:hypothetical protein